MDGCVCVFVIFRQSRHGHENSCNCGFSADGSPFPDGTGKHLDLSIHLAATACCPWGLFRDCCKSQSTETTNTQQNKTAWSLKSNSSKWKEKSGEKHAQGPRCVTAKMFAGSEVFLGAHPQWWRGVSRIEDVLAVSSSYAGGCLHLHRHGGELLWFFDGQEWLRGDNNY